MGAALGSHYGAMTVAAEILKASSTHRVSSLRPDLKIEKFDMKTNFYKQKNPLLMCRNVRSIE
jgi:hypothetical protein